jgi:hypothetical protein
MDIHELKVELTRRILEIESEELLKKVLEELEGEADDFYLNLSESQKRNIEKSRKQISDGDAEDWDVLKKRYL